MKISDKYKPLFDIPKARTKNLTDLKDKDYWESLNTVGTIIVTGGRFSVKSFAVSMASCNWAVEHNHRILFTRYTMASAKDSIIPEFNEKIDLLNYEKWLKGTVDRFEGSHNNSKIVFKGIKTSAGNMTANLKSLKDFSCFILDEGEEMPDYHSWEKISLSIRVTDVQNLNVIIMNPATKEHWVYTKFFEEKNITEGFNGIKDGVLYIHTYS